jgi:methionyl aminopeptidase
MALKKTKEEIDKMREGGLILSAALKIAVEKVAPGVTIKEVNDAAEKHILDSGAKPSFKNYKSNPTDTPFPSTVCVSVNQEIVHGLGDREQVLKEGDVVGLDIGCWYKGLCTDMAVSVVVGGNESDEIKQFLSVTKGALLSGVAAAKVGGSIKDISRAIEAHASPHGYSIVRALVGHGVGHEVHELPHVPNFVSNNYPEEEIIDGMCLALEPMFGLGKSHQVETGDDGWAIIMKDGSIGGHFEVTIAITEAGAEILTPLPV